MCHSYNPIELRASEWKAKRSVHTVKTVIVWAMRPQRNRSRESLNARAVSLRDFGWQDHRRWVRYLGIEPRVASSNSAAIDLKRRVSENRAMRSGLVAVCVALWFAPGILGAQNEASEEERPSELDRAVSHAVAAEYEEALQIFERLLVGSPEDPLLHYYVAITSLKLERVEKGIAHLEEAVEREASFPQAYLWLGEAYLQMGEAERALGVVKRGLSRFPRNEALRELSEQLKSLPAF